VTPEAARFLAKAADLEKRARKMLEVGLFEDAGREAYLVAFHAAQALIFERTGKLSKSHKGVHTEYLRLTRVESRFDANLRNVLSTSYNLKSIGL